MIFRGAAMPRKNKLFNIIITIIGLLIVQKSIWAVPFYSPILFRPFGEVTRGYAYDVDRISGIKTDVYSIIASYGNLSNVSLVYNGNGDSLKMVGVAVDASTNKLLFIYSTKIEAYGNAANQPTFIQISDVQVTSAGDIFVLDKGAGKIFKLKFDYTKTNFSDQVTNNMSFGSFNAPECLALDFSRNILYVADTGNKRVLNYTFEGKTVFPEIANVEFSQITIDACSDIIGLDQQNNVLLLYGPNRGALCSTFALSTLDITSTTPLALTSDGICGLVTYLLEKNTGVIHSFATRDLITKAYTFDYLCSYQSSPKYTKVPFTDLYMYADYMSLPTSEGGLVLEANNDRLFTKVPDFFDFKNLANNEIHFKMAYYAWVDIKLYDQNQNVVKVVKDKMQLLPGTNVMTMVDVPSYFANKLLDNNQNSIPEGVYDLKIQIHTDSATGPLFSDISQVYRVDYTPPKDFSIISPVNGEVINAREITVSWENKNDSDIEKFQLYGAIYNASTGYWEEILFADNIPPDVFSVHITGLQESTYDFGVKAIDYAGNWRWSSGTSSAGDPKVRWVEVFIQYIKVFLSDIYINTKRLIKGDSIETYQGIHLGPQADVKLQAATRIDINSGLESDDGSRLETEIVPDTRVE